MTNIHNSILKVTTTTVLVAIFGVICTLGGGTTLAMLNACSYDDVMSMEPFRLMSMQQPPILHAAAAESSCSSPLGGLLLMGVLLFAAGFLFHDFTRLGRPKHQ